MLLANKLSLGARRYEVTTNTLTRKTALTPPKKKDSHFSKKDFSLSPIKAVPNFLMKKKQRYIKMKIAKKDKKSKCSFLKFSLLNFLKNCE